MERHALVELTKRCDCRCPHCFTFGGEPKPSKELDAHVIIALINALPEIGISHVTLSGGELSFRADLIEILTGLTSNIAVILFSNGRLIQNSDEFDRVNPFAAGYALSLDGLTDQHDRFRGRFGSFRRAVELVRRAKMVGKPVYVQTMVLPSNWEHLEEIVAFAADMGVDELRLSHVGPQGRALANTDLFLPSYLFPQLQQRAQAYRHRYNLRVITNLMDQSFLAQFPERFPRPTLHILPDGHILPWFGLPLRWSLGTVTGDSTDVTNSLKQVLQVHRCIGIKRLFSSAYEDSLRYPHACVPVDDVIFALSEHMAEGERGCEEHI